MDSALVPVPFGTSRVEARNWPTSVRLHRLSTQSFSPCDSGSLPAIAGVPARRDAVERGVRVAPLLEVAVAGGALGTARHTFESAPLATAVFSVGATPAARFCE